jgi:hypothetical protein
MTSDPHEINRLGQKAKDGIVCGEDEWRYSNRLFALNKFDSEHPILGGAQILMIVLICLNCHNIVLFCPSPMKLMNRGNRWCS